MGMGCGYELSRVLIAELSAVLGKFSILWISATSGLLGPNFLDPTCHMLSCIVYTRVHIKFATRPEVQISGRARGY